MLCPTVAFPPHEGENNGKGRMELSEIPMNAGVQEIPPNS